MKAFLYLIAIFLVQATTAHKAFCASSVVKAQMELTELEWKLGIAQWEYLENPDLPKGKQSIQELADLVHKSKTSLSPARMTASALSFSDAIQESTPPQLWSSLQWGSLQKIFGSEKQRALLKTTFNKSTQLSLSKDTVIVLVRAPQERWMNSLLGYEGESKFNSRKIHADCKERGINIEEIELSSFDHIEEQAHELYERITGVYKDQKILILTSELGSAIFYRAVDFHPELTVAENIKGWVNWNGLLFGETAHYHYQRWTNSQKKIYTSVNHRQWLDSMRIYQDGFVKNLDMKMSFPVVNIIDESLGDSFNLREAIVPEGSTIFYSGKTQPAYFYQYLASIR